MLVINSLEPISIQVFLSEASMTYDLSSLQYCGPRLLFNKVFRTHLFQLYTMHHTHTAFVKSPNQYNE